jgi:hypothetical protein
MFTFKDTKSNILPLVLLGRNVSMSGVIQFLMNGKSKTTLRVVHRPTTL